MNQGPKRSQIRKYLFTAILLCMIYLCIETIAYIAGVIHFGEINLFQHFSKIKDRVASDAAFRTDVPYYDPQPENLIPRVYVLHPYFGMVRDSLSLPKMLRQQRKADINYFDLFEMQNYVPKKEDGAVNILLTGGSVAEHFGDFGEPDFTKTLKEFPAFADKDIRIWRGCSGGYKQPQQLIILNMLLAMGAEFDAVINLDGFNDLILPVAENWPSSINPYYPRRWDLLMAGVLNKELLTMIGEKEYLTKQRTHWLKWFNLPLVNYSPIGNWIWNLRDRSLSSRIGDLSLKIETYDLKDVAYSAKGPKAQFDELEQGLDEMAHFWKTCSEQMQALCDQRGAQYFHFLQPNQYMPNSKPFSDEEKERFTNNFVFKGPTTKGYPLLVRFGRELQESGMNFYDLTTLFQEEERTVYVDDCCHFNELGQMLLAQKMADIIGQQWQEPN